MADNPIYGIGLCGGALGLELGLEAAITNYRTVAVVERETAVAGRMAQRIEEGSLPPLAWWDDVGTFDGNPWRGVVHIVSAGFPCQPFSVAGKRKGKEDDRWIWPDIARIAEEAQPEIVFLENVPGLLLSTNSDFDRWDVEDSPVDSVGGFGTVLADLAELGFHAEWLCLRASDVGASHGRKRVFILAYAGCAVNERWIGPAKARREDGSAENPPQQREWDRNSDWNGGANLATPSNGLIQEPWRGSDGLMEHAASIRAGESADEIYPFAIRREARAQSGGGFGDVGNPDEPGYSIRGDDSGLWECAAVERTGDGRGECREPSERIGLFDGSNHELGIFAYGPSDPRWQDVLVQYPWLRPSYSQAEAESDLRNLVDGMVDLVVGERTGALRALGNGVVPLQAAVAFRILLKRVLSAST